MSSFTSTDALASGASQTLGDPASAPLLPRYRRPLSFGAILDETFRVFRRAWRPLMLALAAAAVPMALLTAVWSIGFSGTVVQSMEAANAVSGSDDFGAFMGLMGGGFGIGTLIVISLLSVLFFVPAYAAVVYITDGELRGRAVPVTDALKRGLRVTFPLVLSGLLVFVLGLLLFIASFAALLLWVFPGLLGLTPLIGVLVWWGKPEARKAWLCWLVILTTPFGLITYFGYRWLLALPAVALEGVGPAEAISRSHTLTRGHWFRLFGSSTVLGMISSVLQAVPGWIIALVVGGISLAIAFTQPAAGEAISEDPAAFMTTFYAATNILSAAAQALGLALVGSIPPIAITLLFQDLRNRHEGADLTERLAAASAPPPAGVSSAASASLSPAPASAPPSPPPL